MPVQLAPLWLVLSILGGISGASAAVPGRYSLDYHLQNLLNEANLLVANARADLSDVKRQEREFRMLQVFRAIPTREELASLRDQMSRSVGTHGLVFKGLSVSSRSKPAKRVPKEVWAHKDRFVLDDSQLVEMIHLVIRIDGDREGVESWMRSWGDSIERMLEPEGPQLERIPAKNATSWRVFARAYRFRDIAFPSIRMRDPAELLREEGYPDLAALSDAQPALATTVKRIQERQRVAAPLYRVRGQFLLNAARMDFFLRKTLKRPTSGAG